MEWWRHTIIEGGRGERVRRESLMLVVAVLPLLQATAVAGRGCPGAPSVCGLRSTLCSRGRYQSHSCLRHSTLHLNSKHHVPYQVTKSKKDAFI